MSLARAIPTGFVAQSLRGLVLAACVATVAHAHDARPLSVSVEARGDHVYVVRINVPASVPPANRPGLVWPEGCDTAAQRAGASIYLTASTGLVRCTASVEGRSLHVAYPLFNPSLSTVFRFTPVSGSTRTSVLAPDAMRWVVPETPSRLAVARDYLALGIEHILAGLDHLLFVTGLLLLARTGRRVVLVVTGFTIGHSVTLSLAALGVVSIAVPAVEAAIALSILFLAAELARGRTNSLTWRYPLIVSLCCGLLHGVGFAAALGEIGLPPDEVTTALVFFNLGVEAGQLAFIVPLLISAAVWRALVDGTRCPGTPASAVARAQAVTRTSMTYCIGIVASFWVVERLAAL